MVEEVGGCGRLQRGARGRKCNAVLCLAGSRLVPPVVVGRARAPKCQPVVRRRCYHGFHVLRHSGVPRVPANGTPVDCEQLREDDQHVLEHHEFHVSAASRFDHVTLDRFRNGKETVSARKCVIKGVQ